MSLQCKKVSWVRLQKLKSLSSHGALNLSAFPSHHVACCLIGCSCRSAFRCEKICLVIRSQASSRDTQNQRGGLRKRFRIRLRPRLRLLSNRLKKVSLEEVGMSLRRNSRNFIISSAIIAVFGLCYLFLRLTAVPSSKVVPYSDLIMNLQAGCVTKVLFEEGSRRIFYNTAPLSLESSQVSMPNLLPREVTESDPASSLLSSDFELSDTIVSDSSGIGSESGTEDMSLSVEEKPITNKRRWRISPETRLGTPEWQYSTRKIDHDENFLLGLMREKGTTYSSAPQSLLLSMRSVLITIISLWIPLTPLMWLLYRQLSAANSPAKKRRSYNQTVSFDDVEGVDAAKSELMEIVSCLQGSINYTKLGAKLPRGVLLVGPPGTGKTLLARAVAGEAGVPFFTVSASEFVELFVGRGAARIRDLFSTARKCAPSIIFIDELDAVGGKRGRSFNDERDQTLNQLLTEMDGFESDMKVVVIAATNRPEALDPALCRPGRFSRKVFVGEPDATGRQKIIAVHLRGVPLEEDPQVICSLVASLTPGFVGADLANIINEASLLAARRGGDLVTREDIMEAIERARFGINVRPSTTNAISKELGRLFPWMPSLVRRNVARDDGSQQPLGYQTLT
ncbi:probable inactive ATP-dependent zinc metalloprotease FTSHI 3, chloroplastic isoform X2 [Nymphaea colorata]|nr:probable inactive ATP-dependent zinc metalloprotease FTSHI 3, chloroplastic isoform X2 [Nymphaea colorata]XP_031480544.1 probable inactive ATP-dependent zinc metalloprotease FTSHI 3, chloroplastic isoform X2 [Nymphaea colorata]